MRIGQWPRPNQGGRRSRVNFRVYETYAFRMLVAVQL